MKNEVDVLAALWLEAKQAEARAKERRLTVEAQIAELLGVADEGVINAMGSEFKIKTTGKLTRTLHSDDLQRDWDSLPSGIKECVSWQPKLNMRALRTLESNHNELSPVMARYMTTKPAKPTITIGEINNGN